MSTKIITITALFAALGIVIPQLFHVFGGTALGTILLPMHLPVFIGAMYLGARSGIIIASVSVIIGIMLGMPPLFIGLFMLVELNVYAVVAGLLRTRTSWNVYFVFFIAKILGLLALFVSVNIALGLSFDGLPPVYGSLGMFVPGIPGIILQILIVSPIVVLLEKRRDSFDY